MPHTRRSTWCSLRRLGPVRRCALLLRSGLCCEWCGVMLTQETAQIDHVISRARWPEGHPGRDGNGNLVAACEACNERRPEGCLRPTSVERPVDLAAGLRLARAWYPWVDRRREENRERKRSEKRSALVDGGAADFPFGAEAPS